jgi:hypothetical protein
MVSILPPNRSRWQSIGDAMTNLGRNTPQLLENRYQRQQGLSAIDQLQKALTEANGDISKMLPAIAKAYTLNPNLERSGLAEQFLKQGKAKRSQDVQLPGEQPGQATQGQQLPNFLNQQQHQQQGQFFPSNVGSQQAPGNLPQPATAGQIEPLLTPTQKIPEAKRLAKQLTDAGIPTTPQEAMTQVNANEQDKKQHNQTVENERKQRVSSQKEYGQRAVEELKKVHPNTTPEQETIFQKKGEEEAAKGKSEAEINRFLAVEAKKFKNSLVNVDKAMSAPRLQNMIGRALNGTYKDLEQSGADLRSHLKPILDLGLYDTARKLLTDKGYYPEERDAIINPLSERANITLNKVPKVKMVKSKNPSFVSPEKEPINLNNIKSGLIDLKTNDPNFSLVLARKSFEDKGYDWRSYKDALNQLEQEGFELTDDQNIQKGHLDTPPLNMLQEILHGMNIIGK